MREYLERANDEILAIGTIEHIDAVNTVADVVATHGLDLVFIGPGDLATSMGLKGRADDPAVVSAIRKLESVILPSPVLLGGVAHTVDQANAMIDRGYKALVVGFDWSLLQRGIAGAITDIRTGSNLNATGPELSRYGADMTFLGAAGSPP
jgi:4-hydroxy-2-oxoheptanedioate aldolase